MIMRLPIKVYYYSLHDIDEATPFSKLSMKAFLANVLGITDNPPVFTDYQVPSDLTTHETIYNELLSLIYGRYYHKYIFKIARKPYEADPNQEEIESKFIEWGYKFISHLNMTYEYYMTLLNFYRDAQTKLMDDIKATSKNKVKFNDTPQNANTSGVYEGDDYINQFTQTEGESSSPLNSKIMRLKEIQDNYKDALSDWVKGFEILFIEEAHYEEC